VERAFGTVQQQFLVEVDAGGGNPARDPVAGLEELNDLLEHWVRGVCHQRAHTETGQSPQERFAAAGPAVLPDPAALRAAFSWPAVRLVRKTATVELEGNRYSVDPFLVAASLGDDAVGVHLRDVLGGLDRRNIALVTAAITAANGS
jgi:putative transposase